ncbi:hypothetical protein L198_06330 [Cryptococcus wingfieldii CBS 7118]|uniref:Uncharacterized protein n=1 Tax=Cryptococcus wingfieldii CBS 7118 TaxID=1295528 RepID=A0A1E3IM13_9TREE|nr:hypothetical protein L198_06330 [Cryptococcus wingfieldii CBS 7118]ODN89643.1 hypothetical protein L198_06330 [Cryptococcus wingfieldii CBS 7118]
MWLLTVVGKVRGQNNFTFALQQDKTYSIGNSDTCDINVNDKYIRAEEGAISVGPWDVANRHETPSLRWKPKESTKGVQKDKYLLLPSGAGPHDVSTELKKYDRAHETAGQSVDLNASGVVGIYLTDNAWFFVEWKDLTIFYSNQRHPSSECIEIFKQYCIFMTTQMLWDDLPTYLVTDTIRGNHECRLAICGGVHLILPGFFDYVRGRLESNWSPTVDSYCSMDVPIPGDNREDFRPAPAGNVPFPAGIWLPGKDRRKYFRKWNVLFLKESAASKEVNFFKVMGATVREMDVEEKPLQSRATLEKAVIEWLGIVEDTGHKSKALVIYSNKAKPFFDMKDLEGVCAAVGIQKGTAAVATSVATSGGAMEYFHKRESKASAPSNAKTTNNADSGENSARAPAIHVRPSSPDAPTNDKADDEPRDVVPSTFPNDPISSVVNSNIPQRKVYRRGRNATSPNPPSELPVTAGSSEVGKSTAVSAANLTPNARSSRGPSPQPSFVPDSAPLQSEPPQARTSGPALTAAMSSTQLNSVPSLTGIPTRTVTRRRVATGSSGDSAAPAALAARSRPHARSDPAASVASAKRTRHDVEESSEDESDKYVQALYEKKGNSFGATKKARTETEPDVEMAESTEQSTRASRRMTDKERFKAPSELMQVDTATQEESEEEEPDLFKQTLMRTKRQAAGKKVGGNSLGRTESQNLMPPPTQTQARGSRSASPQPPTRSQPGSSQAQDLSSQTQRRQGPMITTQKRAPNTEPPTRDEAFQAALAKNRKEKEKIDQLDRGLSQMTFSQRETGKEVDKPAYEVSDDFENEETTGNFVEIVRVAGLFRKDLGQKKQAVRGDDGKPNFKKFHKKDAPRRIALKMVLNASIIKEPAMSMQSYWPQEEQKKKPTSQNAFDDDDDDDDRPILPQSTGARRLLRETGFGEDDDEDDDMIPSTSRTGTSTQRSRVPDSQPALTAGRASGREKRAASVVSNASEAPAASSRPRGKGATKTAAAGKKKRSILEDSDEDDDEIVWGTSETFGRSAKNKKASIAGSGTATLDDPPPTATAGRRGTQRKRLVVDDDDDEDGFANFKRQKIH